MRISLIIAYYKDLQALDLIMQSARLQNYDNLEVIVAEDNNEQRTVDYLRSIDDLDIVHTSQKDQGIRKARSQNNAIIKSTGEYLIFIDGDCIPYSNFVRAHASLAEAGHVLSGRRVNMSERFSKLMRAHKLSIKTLEALYPALLPALMIDGASHVGQGIALNPRGWLYNKVQNSRKSSNLNLLGCNFSCFKKDIVAIDGFDESYGETAVPDDTDLQWRFEKYGMRFKTCKNAANQIHLYHTRGHQIKNAKEELRRMNARKAGDDYRAVIGLSSH